MKVKVYDQQAKEVGTTTLPSEIFEMPINLDVLHQAVVTQEANARIVHAHVKGRGEVRGGGKKPWRQKGTGRARHGSIRSPLWKGGGKAHGPKKEKIYAKKINRKAKRKALLMALSSKVYDKEFFAMDSISFPNAKTKEVNTMLEGFSNLVKNIKRPTFLIVMPIKDEQFIRAAKNISRVNTIGAKSLNVRDILKYKFLLMSKEAIKAVEETFGKKVV